MTRIEPHDIDSLRTVITELPTRRLKRPYDAVVELIDTIEEALRRGCTYAELVVPLADQSIKLTPTTLRNYVSRARAARRYSTLAPTQDEQSCTAPTSFRSPAAAPPPSAQQARSSALLPSSATQQHQPPA